MFYSQPFTQFLCFALLISAALDVMGLKRVLVDMEPWKRFKLLFAGLELGKNQSCRTKIWLSHTRIRYEPNFSLIWPIYAQKVLD